VAATLLLAAVAPRLEAQDDRFRTGIELINVTATVTDRDGHVVPSLRKDDFAVYENGKQQEIAFFSSERMPVSLGIVLDSSGSMTPEKMTAARSAIERFIFELLDPDDELFFVEFANAPRLAQPWTTDRKAISRAVAEVVPAGGTAIYDAIAAALPVASTGRHRKKALLLISDGNDTNSRRTMEDVQRLIRESDVLVYALGVDGSDRDAPRVLRPRTPFPPPRFQIRMPFPGPGGGGRLPPRVPPPIGGRGPWQGPPGERVDADTLRSLTDDTGGRAEIVRGFADLGPATAKLAEELRSQYFLGYASTEPKDGRWHAIRVEVRGRRATVRARRGFIAS
jgi:VWFA-related protein